MYFKLKSVVLVTGLLSLPVAMHAQVDFKLDGRDVQVHSFASQGFMYSNQNNYLSMPTSQGSFAFTDGGANISTQLTDKFRVGAQIYLRNIGEFGNWKPELDWGFGDYRFKSWFGVRAGKVKTTLGLLNDTQDMDSLHTFALLPSAIYPVDWRSSTVAHSGADLYGDISVKRLGTFSYTGYAGWRPHDPTSGYAYAAKGIGVDMTNLGGLQEGGDLRWNAPAGILLGASFLAEHLTGSGTLTTNGVILPYHQETSADELAQYYARYSIKGFNIDAEYRRNIRDQKLYRGTATAIPSISDVRGWYFAGTYRICKKLEVGAYRSQYYTDTRKDTTPPSMHEFDTTVSARVDFASHWYLKAEGHFIDGAPTAVPASRGFYVLSNPGGIMPTTNLFVLRTGVSF